MAVSRRNGHGTGPSVRPGGVRGPVEAATVAAAQAPRSGGTPWFLPRNAGPIGNGANGYWRAWKAPRTAPKPKNVQLLFERHVLALERVEAVGDVSTGSLLKLPSEKRTQHSEEHEAPEVTTEKPPTGRHDCVVTKNAACLRGMGFERSEKENAGTRGPGVLGTCVVPALITTSAKALRPEAANR
jgi:hypothetical protein